MILVDSSVWIDHFRSRDPALSQLLDARLVLSHPFVIGELASGHLARRHAVLASLQKLPMAPMVSHDDVLAFVERHSLMGRGIGWVDLHLLASTIVAGTAVLWSNDRRLDAAASSHGVAYRRAVH